MFSVPMTKRKAVRGGSCGRWERAEEKREADLVVEAVLAVAPAPPAASKFLIFCSISPTLLCHCLRRGKRRAVPDATLGTETKTSKWFEGGMGRQEAETSPQQSEGELRDEDATVLSTSRLLLRLSREIRARLGNLRRWEYEEEGGDDEELSIFMTTNPPCFHR